LGKIPEYQRNKFASTFVGAPQLDTSGVQAVEGTFKRGDIVNILDAQGTRLACGITNYASEELAEIKGLKTKMMENYLPALTSNEKPINPFRIYHEMQRILDPKRSLVTGESGSARDQISTIYESITPHSYLGWGNVSTLGFSLAGAVAGKLAFPDWQVVNVAGDAGMGYMMGNMEAPIRYNLGITTILLNNSGYAGYGPGFWGGGDNPYTCDLTSCDKTHIAKAMEGLGMHAERVTEPSEIAPAIKRALDENAQNRPAFIEVVCIQYPVWGTFVGRAKKGTERKAKG